MRQHLHVRHLYIETVSKKLLLKFTIPHNYSKLNSDDKSCGFVDPSHVGYEKQPQMRLSFGMNITMGNDMYSWINLDLWHDEYHNVDFGGHAIIIIIIIIIIVIVIVIVIIIFNVNVNVIVVIVIIC